jgi:cell division protein FtsN
VVAKDYKRNRGRREGFSGWVGLLIGLAMGLAVGLALYYFDPRDPRPNGGTAGIPVETDAEPASARESAADTQPDQYDFYQMLPNFEVVVAEREAVVPSDAPEIAEKEGAYVLQAGSYRKPEDADRVRAQLALQGIESNVQRVAIDADTWHRVRIGPISDPAELERVRSRLREAEVDFLVVRVGD